MPPLAAPSPLFREVQPLRSPWLWLTILGSYGLTLGIFGWLGYQQLILGQPVGAQPLPNQGLIALLMIFSILGIVSVVLLYRLKLIVEVYPDRLWIWFYPLNSRLIPGVQRTIYLNDIRDYQCRTYRPLRDYGGWGLRRSWRDRAYTVSGTQGVQVTLHNSEAFLIGSQRAEELVDAIAIAIAQYQNPTT